MKFQEVLHNYMNIFNLFFSVMKTEIAIGSTLKEVEKFDKTNMKNVDVQEKNPLPDKEGMLFL